MELQERAIRVSRLIETLIQYAIKSDWRFPGGGRPLADLERGIAQMPAIYGLTNLSESRITDYIVYQIYRGRTAIQEGRWQYTWLFSQTAKDKFKQQFLSANGKSGINYYIDRWLDENDLSRSALTALIADAKPHPLRRMVYLPSEEPIKKRFYNTPEGLALCQLSTTGWSPLSEACKGCDNWIECGKITAQKYPELMRFRKEAYGNTKK